MCGRGYGLMAAVWVVFQMFSTFLGPEALLKLFDQPFATHDARDIPAESVHERAEVSRRRQHTPAV